MSKRCSYGFETVSLAAGQSGGWRGALQHQGGTVAQTGLKCYSDASKRMVGWVPRANCVDRGHVIGTAGGAEGTGEPRVRVVAQGAVPDATGSN